MRRFLAPVVPVAVLVSVLGACDVQSSSEQVAAAAEPLTANGVTTTLSYSADWGSGYCAKVTLVNGSTAAVTSWTAVVEMNQAKLSSLWDGAYTASGTRVTVNPASYNASISASGSVSFGFCANRTGSNYKPTLISLAVVGGGGSAPDAGTPDGGSASACGTVTNNPFGDCKFAWGAPDNGANSSYLSFVSGWIGYETRGGLDAALAINVACDGCRLAKAVASTKAMAVLYTYFIGFQANYMGGFGDCNVDHDGHNLCTDGAQWIRDNRALIVKMYGEYAKKVYAASPNKPVIWWLEGDFVQYSYSDQSNPLSYAELGALARDITCAIKSNQPNAVVAMNHSPWISNDQANGFWGAQPLDVLDLVWVQGAGDTDTFVNSGTYNAATANFGWLHKKTGRKIMAETSFAGSGSADRWSTTTAANINARIANGVVGVLVNNPGASYQSAIDTLSPSLSSTCN